MEKKVTLVLLACSEILKLHIISKTRCQTCCADPQPRSVQLLTCSAPASRQQSTDKEKSHKSVCWHSPKSMFSNIS